jgi:hypothetical protein
VRAFMQQSYKLDATSVKRVAAALARAEPAVLS